MKRIYQNTTNLKKSLKAYQKASFSLIISLGLLVPILGGCSRLRQPKTVTMPTSAETKEANNVKATMPGATDLNGFPLTTDALTAETGRYVLSADAAKQKIQLADQQTEATFPDEDAQLTSNGNVSAFVLAKQASLGVNAKSGDTLALYTREQQLKLDNFFGPLPLINQLKLLKHFPARAIYVNNGENLTNNLALINNSELNAALINVKSDSYFHYPSNLALVRSSNTSVEASDDLKETIARLKAAGVHVIGKVSCFRDTLMARSHPELAIKDRSGVVINWANEGESSFLNPYNLNVWRYIRDTVYEAIDLGCDEILLDQVRFPFGQAANQAGAAYYGEAAVLPDKIATLARFLEFMRVEVSDKLAVPLGVSMYDLQSPNGSMNSGQSYLTFASCGIDSITPNLFPADYANASPWSGNGVGTELNGELFKAPDLEPYKVISAAYNQFLNRFRDLAKKVAYRPYLQAFTAYYLPANYRQEYGPEQILAEIQALKDNGINEYILWNSEANYANNLFSKQLTNQGELPKSTSETVPTANAPKATSTTPAN